MQKSYVRLEGTALAPARLRDLGVALVGLGALGSEIAKCLGLAGAGHVVLIDPDRVDETNLTRGLFYTDAVGRPKAVALADAAARLFPATRWTPVAAGIADTGWGHLRACQLLFGAVDRDSARLELARIGTRLGIPVCDGGLATQGSGRGRVSFFPGTPAAACFGCRLTAARRRQLLSSWQSSVHPCALAPPEPGGWSSTPTLASIVGAWQVEAAMRALSASAAFSIDLEIAPTPHCQRFELAVNPACPFHEPPPTLVAAGPGAFGDWMPGPAVSWEWSMCLRARCLACGESWNPRRRTALLLRDGRCPACQSPRLRVEESVRSVRQDSALARLAPAELGLPADHLYTVETTDRRTPQH